MEELSCWSTIKSHLQHDPSTHPHSNVFLPQSTKVPQIGQHGIRISPDRFTQFDLSIQWQPLEFSQQFTVENSFRDRSRHRVILDDPVSEKHIFKVS